MTSRSTLSKLCALAMLSLLAACADSVTQPATLAPTEALFAKGGSGANAKLCRKGGYLTLARADGSTFATEKDCTSYARDGGAFWPPAVLDVVGEVVNGGLSFNFNVSAQYLQPGSMVHIYATGIDYTFGPLVDGSIGIGTGTVCGLGITDWYATGVTITGAIIESEHLTGCP
jgi:hypothetical protein